MKIIALLTISAALTACAIHPAAIHSAATDHRPYMVYDCEELTIKSTVTDRELRRYVASQTNARTVDVLTWPISTARLFGKNKRNVAAIQRLGGELEALEKARSIKCGHA